MHARVVDLTLLLLVPIDPAPEFCRMTRANPDLVEAMAMIRERKLKI